MVLVLRRYPYGETSLIVHALSRTHGRIHILAKGAYRLKSRYSGVLDLFDTLRLEWRASKGSELAILSAGSITARRLQIPRDLERYRTALSILELVDLAAVPGRPELALFDLTERWLDLLAAGRAAPWIASIAFDLRFLQNLGLSPALAACAACGKSAAPPRGRQDVAFSPGAGGRLCEGCAAEARSAGRRVETRPLGVLRVTQSLLEADPASLERFRVERSQAEQVQSLVQCFLEYHLELRPRTRARRTAHRTAPPAR
ncbi:MAG: DNA repair protein RecO [Planctomycetota bacterium]|nr:DNA repair protein RecO [Planctomycetota bacterium]